MAKFYAITDGFKIVELNVDPDTGVLSITTDEPTPPVEYEVSMGDDSTFTWDGKPDFEGQHNAWVAEGDSIDGLCTPNEGYTFNSESATIEITMGGVDITSTAARVSGDNLIISIPSAEANVVIIAIAAEVGN